MDEEKNLAVIQTRGSVIVNSCGLIADHDGVKLLSLDLKTKYAEILFTGYSNEEGPTITFGTGENTLFFDGESEELTTVAFPRFRGYSVFAQDVGRYTCTVVLWKVPSLDGDKYTDVVFFDEHERK